MLNPPAGAPPSTAASATFNFASVTKLQRSKGGLRINATGDIAGNYATTRKGPDHGFVRASGGRYTTFDPPGSIDTVPLCINAGGTIVGVYYTVNAAGGFERAPDGTITPVEIDGQEAGPSCINDCNTITGGYNGSGFLPTSDGTVTFLAPPGATSTDPVSIDSAGDVAGNFVITVGGLDRGFVRAADGTITTLDPKGSIETWVMGIDDVATITGVYSLQGGYPLGFVRTADGHIRTLAVPQANATWPVGIRSRGDVTGYFGGPDPSTGFVVHE